jgi:hypothetical protein
MKERPIIFSTEMVQKILSDTKTQTRRVMNVQPKDGQKLIRNLDSTSNDAHKRRGKLQWATFYVHNFQIKDPSSYFSCPYGEEEDRLWVRETFTLSGKRCIYRADHDLDILEWKPSIFMPRNMSRITLEITKLRVERLNDISVEDAIAEGCTGLHLKQLYARQRFLPPQEHFAHVWNEINGKKGFAWATNPFVWVIEFRRVEV